ncbi:MAG: mechanosensitive ion channel family protein [Candidatus Krumholzibacteriia bacterium]
MTDVTILGNDLQRWAIAAGATAVTAFILGLVVRVLRQRARRERPDDPRGTKQEMFAGAAAALRAGLLFPLALYPASVILSLPPIVTTIVGRIGVMFLVAQIAMVVSGLALGWFESYRRRSTVGGDTSQLAALRLLLFAVRVFVFSAALLVVLESVFDADITALVAGLGVGGIAIALAVQNVLGDLFASLSIVLDKPFVVGDFIIVGDFLGTVEQVGLKTTRVRSLGGEQIVFPNSDLLGSRVRNYKRMHERRIVFQFGLTYGSPAEKLERVPQIVREIVGELDQVRIDRVHFAKFGDFALIFEVVYYVETPDYTVYMDKQQAINLGLKRRLEAEGLEFAFPTQTLYVTRVGGARESDEERGDGSDEPAREERSAGARET